MYVSCTHLSIVGEAYILKLKLFLRSSQTIVHQYNEYGSIGQRREFNQKKVKTSFECV